MSEETPKPQLVRKMDDPPRGQWVFGYSVCRECVDGPGERGWWWYWIDEDGRSYCVECAPPLQPDDGGGRQTALFEAARLNGLPRARTGGQDQ